jgi:hypothetical protein
MMRTDSVLREQVWGTPSEVTAAALAKAEVAPMQTSVGVAPHVVWRMFHPFVRAL